MNKTITILLAMGAMLVALAASAMPRESAIKMCNQFAGSHPKENREAFIQDCMNHLTIDSPAPTNAPSATVDIPGRATADAVRRAQPWGEQMGAFAGLSIILFVIGLVIAILWICVPFLIMGTNRRLDKIIK